MAFGNAGTRAVCGRISLLRAARYRISYMSRVAQMDRALKSPSWRRRLRQSFMVLKTRGRGFESRSGSVRKVAQSVERQYKKRV